MLKRESQLIIPTGMQVCTNPSGPGNNNKNSNSYDEFIGKQQPNNIYYGMLN